MTRKIVKALVATVSLAALVLGTGPSMAHGHGGGGGGRGGGGGHHFGGGGAHFSGAHFSGARFSGARMGRSRFSAAHISGRNFSRISRGNFAHVNAAHVHGLGAAALGTRAAWNHGAQLESRLEPLGQQLEGRLERWMLRRLVVRWTRLLALLRRRSSGLHVLAVGLLRPVLGLRKPVRVGCDVLARSPVHLRARMVMFMAGMPLAAPARTRVAARRVTPETTGSVTDSADLAQSCGGLAPGVTDLPIDKIQQSLQLNDDQLRSLNALKAASSQASDALKASCSGEMSMTPLGRLDTVQKRLDGMVQAWGVMRTPLDDFYNSLNDEQKQRFAALGPASGARSNRRGPASGDNLAARCNSRTENFTQLPVQRVEQAVRPTQQQQGALEKLKAASTEAANQLQASCPAQSPQTPLDRFDAVGKRLDAMAGAVKTVRPALADFYSSLTDEQKARFNTLGPPQNTGPRQG